LSSIGEAKAIESGGIEALLAAVTNHLNSADVCEIACWAMYNIVQSSNGNIGLLISLGGGAAAAKVRTRWSENDNVQAHVRKLAYHFAAEWKTWTDWRY
jgi:hypothetical protein